ncbi:phosphotransferase family protein [Pseudonocardia sp. RS010]|uniref:phosphotransferase family protein n=1 Tax=Pseudonocardia sp. RS010 TaxID=3385979 RepID=UPI0039A36575
MAIPRHRTPEESSRLLRTWLVARLPEAREVEITDLASPQIGYSAETLLFDARWRDGDGPHHERLVARIRPSGYVFFPDVDLRLHHDVLAALADTDVPVPRPRWYQDAEGSPFGEPFFVMERIEGLVPPEHPAYTAGGWVAEASPDHQRRIFHGAVEALARLHRVDRHSLDLSFLPSVAGGDPGMTTELKLFEEYVGWVLDGQPDPLFDDTLDTLRNSVPKADRLCMNWGDPKFSNILYRGTRPVGLLDWELATVGPPENDLAFFLTYHNSITRALGHPDLPGFLGDDAAIALYEELSGHEIRHLDWYRLWHLLRLGVMSLRLTQLLVQSGRLPEGSPKAPHHVPRRLLQNALKRFR